MPKPTSTFASRLNWPIHQKTTWYQRFWLLAPVAIWFSYRPVISLGRNESTNFELSIPLLYVVILSLFGLSAIWQHRNSLAKSRPAWLVFSFVVISALSLLWTPNFTRGILTLGVVGVLFLIFLAALAQAEQLKKILPAITYILVVSAAVMSFLAFVQVVAGIWLNRTTALLCPGCTPQQFGFARPDVFTIEPQFLGNLLLIPATIMAARLLAKKRQITEWLVFALISSTLLLTLSRGAIFAFTFSLAIVVLAIKPTLYRLGLTSGVLFSCLVGCLIFQGSVAAANPKLNTSFYSAVSASVNQLSLGKVSLPPESKTKPVTSDKTVATSMETTANYTGYVAESTNVRTKLSRLSLQAWRKTPDRMLFGVGLGGSGVVLRNEFPSQVNQREIVQNEFVEILLENGLIGVIIFMAIMAGLFVTLKPNKWLWSILVAILVQWNFFSGYPNALHIYLLLTVLFAAYRNQKHLIS